MSSSAATAPVSKHPPVGTRIDGNSLELVEVLGTGGYGVVYRAVDVNRQSYAVKCVAGTYDASSRRHLHMREIALHQLASAHPSIITLHRVVRQRNFTFLIMDYAPEGDLFEQILQAGTYLGRDNLIKHVFLQILDAVQHCHSLGIFHRDLKPENVLCFDHGIRVAITDFGLATTEKKSTEYKTGSVYHMSPECQTSDTQNGGTYSPLYNDIWCLGIMLLNLATGRNPWKSATLDDSTYRAYRGNPRRFLTTILPISEEFNSVLVRALAVDWKKRISLSDFRKAVISIRTFYSDKVVFDGNLATFIWEFDLHLKSKRQKKPHPDVTVSSWPPSRAASQITTIEGLMDEEALGWEPKFKRVTDSVQVSCHSPVHSIYQYSLRTSSSDSASPITPVSDYGDGSQTCSFVEWDVYRSNDVEEESRYPEEHRKQVSIPVSAFDDDGDDGDDDGSYVSSVFHTPSLKDTVRMPQTHADNFRTVKRHSSPNTSIYSITEAFDGMGPTSMRNVERVDKGETAAQQRRAQPVDIPRSKSKTSIFNPMRFFPRSAGKSWLNRKVRF